MPRWPGDEEDMDAVAKLIVDKQGEDRVPYLEEVMAVTGVRTKRTAARRLRKAGVTPKAGRPWPPHSVYMPQVLELAQERAKSGRSITAAEIEKMLNVGPDVSGPLLANLGLVIERREDDELLDPAEAIIKRLGDQWSYSKIAAELHISRRRAKRLAERLGVVPEEIAPGHSAAGSTWWTGAANEARWAKREETR